MSKRMRRTRRKLDRRMRPVTRRTKKLNKRLAPAKRRFNVATRRARILPGFLIIGAQRAGTTSLFHYLSRHPDVAPPSRGEPTVRWYKELHFFDENYWRGLDWYRSFFPLETTRRFARLRGHDLVAGEATPYYLIHPAVPARVAASVPDVRCIVLLRDPVERAYSHYQLMCRKGWENLSFEEALEAEPERVAGTDKYLMDERPQLDDTGRPLHKRHKQFAYLERGLYAEQLERWFDHFPREQLLVLRAEDLLESPKGTYKRVLDFVGLRRWKPRRFVTRNTGSYASIDPKLRARLEEHFREPNAQLARLLGEDFGWSSPLVPRAESVSVSREGA